jgi:hypothetical protein
MDMRISAQVPSGAICKARLALPRPIVVDTLSASLVGLRMYWFISRSYA